MLILMFAKIVLFHYLVSIKHYEFMKNIKFQIIRIKNFIGTVK